MAKTSFISKKSEKLEHKRQYYDSCLVLYEHELAVTKEEKLEAVNKNEKEALNEILSKENELKIQSRKEKLAKKYQKKVEHSKKVEKNERKRIWEIDFVRGVIILGMLVDHFIGDFWMVTNAFGISNANPFFSNMFTVAIAYWDSPIRVAFRLVGVMLLLVLSGISASFSRNSLKHSILILIVGGLMSAVFGVCAVIMNSFTFNVIMGAVTCIGLCLFIYSLTKLIFQIANIKKYFKWFSLVMAIGILVMWGFVSYLNPDRLHPKTFDSFWYIYNNYVGCIKNIYTPDELKRNLWKVLLGLNYFGSDWLPLFPYLGYMFLGGFIGETVYAKKESLLHFVKSKNEISTNHKVNHYTSGITFFGKHSIWFYLGHQPVYIVIILIIALIMGCTIRL